MEHPAIEAIEDVQCNIELKVTHLRIPNFSRMEGN